MKRPSPRRPPRAPMRSGKAKASSTPGIDRRRRLRSPRPRRRHSWRCSSTRCARAARARRAPRSAPAAAPSPRSSSSARAHVRIAPLRRRAADRAPTAAPRAARPAAARPARAPAAACAPAADARRGAPSRARAALMRPPLIQRAQPRSSSRACASCGRGRRIEPAQRGRIARAPARQLQRQRRQIRLQDLRGGERREAGVRALAPGR